MARVYESVNDLIGKTPLLRLSSIEQEYGLKARLLAKLEMFNPAGSAKDRVAKYIFADLQEKGLLSPDTVII